MLLALNASGQAIIQIASADGVSFFVKSDGSLWRGDFAHAVAKEGNHTTSANFEPVELIVCNGVTTVAMNGQRDTFFIKDNGSLWAMGNNEGGFLGDGTFETPEHPVQLVPGGVVAVACGEDFTMFLKGDGSVWGFGWNGNGQFGDGTKDVSVYRPKQFISGGVAAIAAGHGYSLFIKRDGSLWGTGFNGYGQLGLGTNVERVLQPVEIVPANVVSVAACDAHTLFIKGDGSLWAMGLNDWGQIGDCSIDWCYRPKQIASNNVAAVTAGRSGSLFLKKDGSLWGMGINWGSDYGEGIEFHSRCPTQIFAGNNPALVAGYYYNAQLKTCASLWAGQFNNTPPMVGSSGGKARLASSIAGLPGYNLITIEQLNDGNVRLTYSGNAGANYALERSSNLANPKWVKQGGEISGVRLGMTMQQVVDCWGKPRGGWSRCLHGLITFSYSGVSLGFEGNHLETIRLSPPGKFAGGLSSASQATEFVRVLGPPTNSRISGDNCSLVYLSSGGNLALVFREEELVNIYIERTPSRAEPWTQTGGAKPVGGANGTQPLSSQTNQTSAAAASGRPH